MTSTRRLPLALPPIPGLVLGLVLGLTVACGTPDDTGKVTLIAVQGYHAGDPTDLALAVTVVSAWPNMVVPGAPTPPRVRIAPDGSFRAEVYDDGEDGGTWSSLTGRLDAATLDDLLGAADRLPEEGYGDPGLDGSTTTIATGDRAIDVWVPESSGYDGAAQDNREAFVDLLERVDDAVRAAGEPWDPDRYLLVTQHGASVDDADEMGCREVGADVAARLETRLDEPRPLPGWAFGGTAYGAVLLPVLTDETCAEIEPFRWPLT